MNRLEQSATRKELRVPASILAVSLVSTLLWVPPIAAQAIPDATLPAGERSQVMGNPNIQIDGGARRGGNLFHSFSQFSIPTGGSAFFNNAADVQNIFSRVTGTSISNIDGLIRSNGTANLFLLNPNGILFGPNASLNIGGSFVGTTANAIGFPNGEVFSSDATQPLPSQLLTVNPNAFFFNQLNPQPIVNRSRFNNTGLQVPLRQNLLLVGGPVQLDGGKLISPGSYVELGSVGGVGTINLSTVQEDWQLNLPDGVTRADAVLRNGGDINVKGAGGSIQILAQNIDIFGSTLRIEIPRDSRLPATRTGDLELNATGSITIRGSILANSLFGEGTMGNIALTAGDRITIRGSRLYSTAEPGGKGGIGDVAMTAKTVLFDNTLFTANTSQSTDASNIFINARDTVSINGSTVFNTVEPTGSGNGGNINITTGALALTEKTQLLSFTKGQGNGGNVNITTGEFSLIDAFLRSYTVGQGNAGSVNLTVRDRVLMDRAGVYNYVESTGSGNAGDVNITTGEFSLISSALYSYTDGRGNVGSVNINAYNTISLDYSDIGNAVTSRSTGNSGSINITTGSLSLTNYSSLISRKTRPGNAGNITINARDRVSIDNDVFIRPTNNLSGIVTVVSPGTVGQGGDVTITTGSLSLSNGGSVNTSTQGLGNAGRVTIHARDSIQINGTSLFPTGPNFPSQVFTSAQRGSVGDGGDVNISTGSLFVANQGRINTTSQGQGKAGNIQIQARDAVLFSGGDALSTLEQGAVGRGGDINVEARSLSLLNNARLSASTSGEGLAGNITASADTVNLSKGGQLLTTTFSRGQAGNITVNTSDLQLSDATSGLFAQTTSTGNAGNLTIQPRGNGQSVRVSLQDGAQISASTLSSGRGGDLTIAAPDSITLTGNGSVIAAGTGDSGNGGNLNLRTRSLSIQNQAEVTVSSSGTGSAGNLFVDADRIYLNNGGRIRADTSGGGGNINLRSSFILLRNSSNISTNARGANIPGGNIGIDTRFLIAVPNEDSNISANSEDFRGGNVSINAFSIFGIQPSLVSTPLSDITATGATSALPGTIDVTTAGIDPTSGLIALPTDVVDPGLIAQGCPANQGNSFVITGRGGLPPNPEQQLDYDAEWQDRRRLSVGSGGHGDTRTRGHGESVTDSLRVFPSPRLPLSASPRLSPSSTPILEASGWQITPMGDVVLVAATSNPAMHNSLHRSTACKEDSK